MEPKDFNLLSENKQKQLASQLVRKRILHFTKWCLLFLVAIMCVLYWNSLIHMVPRPLLNGALIVISLFAIFGLYKLLKSVIREMHLQAMAELSGRKDSSWSENTGSSPSAQLVNVKFVSGLCNWKVNPAELNWSLQAKDPILEYMIARQK